MQVPGKFEFHQIAVEHVKWFLRDGLGKDELILIYKQSNAIFRTHCLWQLDTIQEAIAQAQPRLQTDVDMTHERMEDERN